MGSLVITALIACSLVMALVWCWSYKIKNAGIVDIFWSYNFPVIACILFFLADGFPTRKELICGMVIVGGLRLGTHLLMRVMSHLHEEDGRYAQLRKEWAPHAERKLFWFFQAQGLSNVLLAIPFFVTVINRTPKIAVLEYIALGLWAISVCGEAIADKQLSLFKKHHKGEVCNVGLWRYSRHPNYFFQWMMWVSYAVFALASPYGYLGLISPAIILYLLLRVTGIPATEEQSLRSKGDAFKQYQQKTSAFIPWFPKK
jgi:steroid 5-alpha reductase family enzyme